MNKGEHISRKLVASLFPFNNTITVKVNENDKIINLKSVHSLLDIPKEIDEYKVILS